MTQTTEYTALTHPDYMARSVDWQKWRETYEGGTEFIDRFLKRLSKRETTTEFNDRKAVTYCPWFAGAAVDEVRNSLFQRFVEVKREGGSPSYSRAVQGMGGGVDRLGASMNGFIGRYVLSELLTMARVGVYVDMPPVTGPTLASQAGKRPYCYHYRAEDIRSWSRGDPGEPEEFTSLLLREHVDLVDERTKLPRGQKCRYRHLWVEGGRVHVRFYDEGENPETEPVVLDIPRIPFVLFEISNSLLKNVADYQIALLNLASSDMGYTLKANFPFYTEQKDLRGGPSPFVKTGPPGATGTEAEAEGAGRPEEITVGVTQGRAYPRGLERPAFIHPSSEPLTASMAKQEQLKAEIRMLVHLAISSLKPTRMQSAESKQQDERGLESGLSYIGLELEHGENRIADYWSVYEKWAGQVTVKYPENYSLKTSGEKRSEVEGLLGLIPKVPSVTFQKEAAKQVAELTLGDKVAPDVLAKIQREIDGASVVQADPKAVASDVEQGLVDLETASRARGYPEGVVKKAKKDHAERLKRIAISQAKGGGAARGVIDADDTAKGGADEKRAARETAKDDTVTRKVRGENV